MSDVLDAVARVESKADDLTVAIADLTALVAGRFDGLGKNVAAILACVTTGTVGHTAAASPQQEDESSGEPDVPDADRPPRGSQRRRTVSPRGREDVG